MQQVHCLGQIKLKAKPGHILTGEAKKAESQVSRPWSAAAGPPRAVPKGTKENISKNQQLE